MIFKIKSIHYIELLIPETINLLGRTKSKITKIKNSENVPHLEITEVLLVHCSIANNNYQYNSRVLYKFIPNESFGKLLKFHQKNSNF